MQTLQRVLARGVLEALESREHVVVTPGRGDALLADLEGVIVPQLAAITAALQLDARTRRPASQARAAEHASAKEAASRAVQTMVDDITERLLASNHVDDVFAEDRLIRRDAFRAIRDVLLRYVDGRIDVEEDYSSDGAVLLDLHKLGYVAATVAQRADETTLRRALARAARSVGAKLVSLELSASGRRRAGFDLRGETGLALEEAIHSQMVALVDAERVDLPSIEQVVVHGGAASLPGFAEALDEAVGRVHKHTGCAVACTPIDEHRLLCTLTPLSAEEADNADAHFAHFLETIETALATVLEARASQPPQSRARGVKPAAPASRRRSTVDKKKPSSRRRRQA